MQEEEEEEGLLKESPTELNAIVSGYEPVARPFDGHRREGQRPRQAYPRDRFYGRPPPDHSYDDRNSFSRPLESDRYPLPMYERERFPARGIPPGPGYHPRDRYPPPMEPYSPRERRPFPEYPSGNRRYSPPDLGYAHRRPPPPDLGYPPSRRPPPELMYPPRDRRPPPDHFGSRDRYSTGYDMRRYSSGRPESPLYAEREPRNFQADLKRYPERDGSLVEQGARYSKPPVDHYEEPRYSKQRDEVYDSEVRYSKHEFDRYEEPRYSKQRMFDPEARYSKQPFEQYEERRYSKERDQVLDPDARYSKQAFDQYEEPRYSKQRDLALNRNDEQRYASKRPAESPLEFSTDPERGPGLESLRERPEDRLKSQSETPSRSSFDQPPKSHRDFSRDKDPKIRRTISQPFVKSPERPASPMDPVVIEINRLRQEEFQGTLDLMKLGFDVERATRAAGNLTGLLGNIEAEIAELDKLLSH